MLKHRANLDLIKRAIELAGGMTPLSKKADISYQSILDWKSGRKNPSAINCMKIEKATNGEVRAEEILPDFPWHTLK